MSNKKNEALSWAEKCDRSNGMQILLKDEDKKLAEDFKKILDEFNKKEAEFNTTRREFLLEVDTFWVKIKKSLYESGNKSVLENNLGLDQDAMDEGVLVVNLTKPQPRNSMMM